MMLLETIFNNRPMHAEVLFTECMLDQSASGTYYFISGASRHCQKGQGMIVRVMLPDESLPQHAKFSGVKHALPTLARLIHSNDEEVLTYACWALSYLSDGTNDKNSSYN